jgi:hypothetical protein
MASPPKGVYTLQPAQCNLYIKSLNLFFAILPYIRNIQRNTQLILFNLQKFSANYISRLKYHRSSHRLTLNAQSTLHIVLKVLKNLGQSLPGIVLSGGNRPDTMSTVHKNFMSRDQPLPSPAKTAHHILVLNHPEPIPFLKRQIRPDLYRFSTSHISDPVSSRIGGDVNQSKVIG